MALYTFTAHDVLAGIPEGSPNCRLLHAVLKKNDAAFKAELADMHCAPGLPSSSGVTPLMAALLFGTDAMVDKLLDTHLININQQAAGGVTALHIAASARQEFCRKLRARGADPRLADDGGRCALDFIIDPDLRKKVSGHPSLASESTDRFAGAFERAARAGTDHPPKKEKPQADAQDKKSAAESAILRNDPKALQPCLNTLVIPQEEINALLALSLKTGDQPVIVHMLLTAGADPAADDKESRRKAFQLAFRLARPGALMEIMRKGDLTLSPIDYFNCTAGMIISKDPETVRQQITEALTVHSLRRELRGASAAKLEREMQNAVAGKNPLLAVAVFSESRKKRFLSRSASFDRTLAGEALRITLQAGYLLAAFDMKQAGFNIWDSKIAKELPDPPFASASEACTLNDFMKDKGSPPRVLTPAEKINELRSQAATTGFYPHGPGVPH
jgi:hypothetical protein